MKRCRAGSYWMPPTEESADMPYIVWTTDTVQLVLEVRRYQREEENVHLYMSRVHPARVHHNTMPYEGQKHMMKHLQQPQSSATQSAYRAPDSA